MTLSGSGRHDARSAQISVYPCRTPRGPSTCEVSTRTIRGAVEIGKSQRALEFVLWATSSAATYAANPLSHRVRGGSDEATSQTEATQRCRTSPRRWPPSLIEHEKNLSIVISHDGEQRRAYVEQKGVLSDGLQ